MLVRTMRGVRSPLLSAALAAALPGGLAGVAHAQKVHQFDGVLPPGGMLIPQFQPFVTAGSANPYPASVQVSGVNAPIGEVRVLLTGLSHTSLQDLDVLLVGPSWAGGARTTLLLNRVGGGLPGVSGVDYLIADGAPALPAGAPGGTYRPTQAGIATGFPAFVPAGPYATTLSVFKGTIANGTWSLYVEDRSSNHYGTLAEWSLIIAEAPAIANARPHTIPGASTSGPSSVYPSTARVHGAGGAVESVSVMLLGLNHTYQQDLRALLVGPQGQNCLLLSRCGTGADFAGSTLIIADSAPFPFPVTDFGSGSFRPTACVGTAGAAFSAPAPAPPYGAALSVFSGTNPNGLWRLYLEDAAAADIGTLAGGWVLSINGVAYCPADFNTSGSVTVQDIYDFLAAWTAGCP